MTQWTRRILVPALLLGAAWAGPAAAIPHQFAFNLSGSQEVPPVQTQASGDCVAVLSADESELSVSCTHTVPNPTAAHIHLGVAGVAGPVIFDLGDPASPIVATWSVGQVEVAQLVTGMLYVNVHTAANPDGEVRGQIRARHPLGTTRISFPLSGDQEVPPVTTAATGRCLGELSADHSAFEVVCVHDVEAATAAHIHLGAKGVDGGIIFDLGNAASPIRGTWMISSGAEVVGLFNGQNYVNVHTAANPDGEIRGQIDGCFADRVTLCLLEDRFAVNVTWKDFQDNTGAGQAIGETEDSGMFWFFSPNNVEIQIKVLNACGVNQHVWVFFSGTTNVEFQLTVIDTRTGVPKVYENVLGQVAQAELDTEAFAACPLD